MMSYEFWVKQLLDVMTSIADLDTQRDNWPRGVAVSNFDDPYEWVEDAIDAYTLDLFIEMYGANLTAEQLDSCKKFNRLAEAWLEETSAWSNSWPALKSLPEDPAWIAVTQAAAEFVRAFTPTQPA